MNIIYAFDYYTGLDKYKRYYNYLLSIDTDKVLTRLWSSYIRNLSPESAFIKNMENELDTSYLFVKISNTKNGTKLPVGNFSDWEAWIRDEKINKILL
jgi:hypothetical protein